MATLATLAIDGLVVIGALLWAFISTVTAVCGTTVERGMARFALGLFAAPWVIGLALYLAGWWR